MSRVLINMLLFFVPFIIYALYVMAARRFGWTGAPEKTPHIWLVIAGMALVLLSLGLVAVFDGAQTGKEYVPARVEDGEIVPGGFR